MMKKNDKRRDFPCPTSKVYFTDFRCRIGVSQLDKLRKLWNNQVSENPAIKLHFGASSATCRFCARNISARSSDIKERGGKPFITDCNTLYVGSRKNALSI